MTLKKLTEQLPPDIQKKVRDFAEFLRRKRMQKPNGKLKLNWAGGLKEYRKQWTSLGLQKKALQWWRD